MTIEELASDVAEDSQMIKAVYRNGDGSIDFNELLDPLLKHEEDGNTVSV